MKALADAVIKGDQNTALEITKAALAEGTAAKEVLDDGLIAGMDIVGARFKKNEIFIPEVLLAARAMKMGMDVGKIMEPLDKLLYSERINNMKDRNFIYLMIIGVDSKHQGKGHGGKLIRALIKKSEELNLPIYLETETRF